jgi:hypothetical protein
MVFSGSQQAAQWAYPSANIFPKQLARSTAFINLCKGMFGLAATSTKEPKKSYQIVFKEKQLSGEP